MQITARQSYTVSITLHSYLISFIRTIAYVPQGYILFNKSCALFRPTFASLEREQGLVGLITPLGSTVRTNTNATL